jgi:hypothetical protein
MKVYWVTLERTSGPSVLNLGAGVTARSEEDARRLLEAAFADHRIVGLDVVEDVRTLDQGHVAPNMGNIFIRGVWFPLGYAQVAAAIP